MNNNYTALQEFKNYLEQVIDNHFDILFEKVKKEWFKSDAHTLKVFVVHYGSYCQLQRDFELFLINRKERVEEQNTAKAVAKRCLKDLDFDELKEDTLNNFNKEKEQNSRKNDENTDGVSETSLVQYVEIKEEQILIKKNILLERIDITEIIIPSNNDLLNSPKKRYEFKKRMTDVQNFLTLANYGKALEECEYILNNLELESGQLHEYHAISYFLAKGGARDIVQYEQEDAFKKMVLCIQRGRLFNRNRETTSDTILTVIFEDKIQLICYKMNYVLREYYRNLAEHNYINSGNNQDLRNLIARFISMGLFVITDLYPKKMQPNTLFLEDAFNELMGGRRLDWLEATDAWQIKNKYNLPSIEIRNDIVHILKKTDAFERCKKRLHRNLSKKYTHLKDVDDVETRQAFRRFFKASIVAYKCFEDARFLDLLKEEMLHKGKLKWFDLDEIGKLIPNSECDILGYDPLKDLARLRDMSNQFIDFQKDSVTLYSDLKRKKEIQRVESEIVGEADKKYRELKSNIVKRDIHFRNQIVECIEAWQEAYEIVKLDSFINRIIKELIGSEGLLFWFELDKNAALINHSECMTLGFDAQKELEKALNHSMDYYQTKDAVWKDIKLQAALILEQETNSKYEQL